MAAEKTKKASATKQSVKRRASDMKDTDIEPSKEADQRGADVNPQEDAFARPEKKPQRDVGLQHYEYAAYIAFVSGDNTIAQWLQRRIEGYRIPSHLIGHKTPIGILVDRIGKIFYDNKDRQADGSLSEIRKSAIRESSAMIVVASEAAATSAELNEEIKQFLKVGSARRIYVLLTGADRHKDEQELLPPVLRGKRVPIVDGRSDSDNYYAETVELIAYLLGLDTGLLKSREIFASYTRIKVARWSAAVAAVAAVVSGIWGWTAFDYGVETETKMAQEMQRNTALIQQMVAMKQKYGVPAIVIENMLHQINNQMDGLPASDLQSEALQIERKKQAIIVANSSAEMGMVPMAEKRLEEALGKGLQNLNVSSAMGLAEVEVMLALADLYFKQKKIAKADALYHQALEFTDRFLRDAADGKMGTAWLRIDAQAWMGLSYAQVSLQRFDEAMEALSKAQVSAQQSWRVSAGSAAIGKQLHAETFVAFGDIMVARGHQAKALEYYNAALKMLRELASSIPSINVEMATKITRLEAPRADWPLQAEIYQILEKKLTLLPRPEKLITLKEMSSIAQQYMQEDPHNREWMLRQVQILQHQGQLELDIDNDAAVARLSDAAHILEMMNVLHGGSEDWLRTAQVVYDALAGALTKIGDDEAARKYQQLTATAQQILDKKAPKKEDTKTDPL